MKLVLKLYLMVLLCANRRYTGSDNQRLKDKLFRNLFNFELCIAFDGDLVNIDHQNRVALLER